MGTFNNSNARKTSTLLLLSQKVTHSSPQISSRVDRSSAEFSRSCKARARMANVASHPTAGVPLALTSGDRSSSAFLRERKKEMQTAAKLLLGKDAIKLSSDWGPANLNLSLDVVDIFANNYNIFEPEVRRGFFYALFFTRGLNSTAAVQGKSSSKTSSTNSNVFDAVIELGAKDQDQWVQAISKAIKSRKEKEKVALFSTFNNVYAPLESSYLNSSRTTTRGSNSDQTTSTSNKHFTLKKLEKPRRKSYLEVSAKRVNRFGDVISNVDSSTTGATTTGSTAT